MAGHHGSDLHDLLLIDDDPVGLFEDRFEQGMGVDDLHASVPPLHEIVDHSGSQRPRPIKGVERDQIFELFRNHASQDIAHARRLELKNTRRISPTKQSIGGLIRQREILDVRHFLLGVLDRFQAVGNQSQGL